MENIEAVAHCFCNGVDGQHGGIVLDLQSWKTVEDLCSKWDADDCGLKSETGINWKYCPTDKNLADLGSTGAGVNKLKTGEWFIVPEWLLDKHRWSAQPNLKSSRDANEEHKPFREKTFYNKEQNPDEWTTLLTKNKYWGTPRITTWALRFLNSVSTSRRCCEKRTGPPTTEEIKSANNHWIKRVQRNVPADLQIAGFEPIKEEETGILKFKERIPDHQPTYFEGGLCAE